MLNQNGTPYYHKLGDGGRKKMREAKPVDFQRIWLGNPLKMMIPKGLANLA